MEIECHHCQYTYAYERYGSRCPHCGNDNQPFRSAAASTIMDEEEPSSRYHRLGHERRQAILRSGDPMYGARPLRRIRPMLMLLAICFAVAAAAAGMIRMANEAKRQATADLGAESNLIFNKPPIQELASANFNLSFPVIDGAVVTVNATGIVDDGGELANPGQRCVFVDYTVTVTDRTVFSPSDFVRPVLVYDGNVCRPQRPEGDWLENYTPLKVPALKDELRVSGQVFYLLPETLEEFFIEYRQDGQIMQAKLHL